MLNDTLNWAHLSGATWFVSDSGITVRNCLIQNITNYPGHVVKDAFDNLYGCGLNTASTDGILIEKNDFKKIGYIGTRVNDGVNVTLQNNTVDSFEFTLDDAGAYYWWGSPTSTRTLHDRYCLNNVATHGLATGFGTPPGDLIWGAGIYTDDNCDHIVISGNTVAHTTYNGIYLHNNNNITILHNLLYDNNLAAIETQHDASAVTMNNIIVRGNTMLANTTGQHLMNIRSNWNDFGTMFSDIDSNYYGRATNDNGAFIVNWFSNSTNSYTFSGWKPVIADEAHSRETNIADVTKVVLKTNYSKVVNKDYQLCTACSKLDGTTVANKFTLVPWASNLLLKP
jgi:parallel beta-helix repeat protein